MFPNMVIANTTVNIDHHNLQTDCFMVAELDIFQREPGSANLNVWWEFKGQILTKH